MDASTSYRHSNTPAPTDVGLLLRAHGFSNRFYDARVTVDLDGDGVPELFVAPGRVGTHDTTASLVFKRGADGNYADVTSSFFQGPVPALVHPRKALSADFNGDGRADLFVLDHGYDYDPFPGARNVLALSDATTGRLAIKEIPSSPVGFHHCGAAGDIDNNGTTDVFACSQGWQTTAAQDKSAYFLLNDGKGNMTISRAGIPASIKAGSLLASELVDIDRDGRLDLILGHRSYNQTLRRDEMLTTIFWGSGNGQFTDSKMTRLPLDATFNSAYDFKAEDVDGDGRRDVLVLAVRENLSGYYVHIFRQTEARTFADESLPRIIKDANSWEGHSNAWFPWLHLTDLNADGSRDIAIGDSSAHIPARNIRWLNNGQGVFTRAAQ